MYCTTCSSLAPRCNCSRISRRRSSDRPAGESAMVWFWHTRQRSSAAIFSMRASSAGSAAAGAASFACAKPIPSTAHSASLTTNVITSVGHSAIQFLQQRHDARLQYLGRHRPHVLEADHAGLVDHKGLGHAVDAEVDADAAIEVRQRQVVRVAELLEPRLRVVALVLVV